MEITAKLSQYRQAPRKVRLVGNLLKGRTASDALLELKFRSKRAAPVFAKLLESALANAKAKGLSPESLTVKGIRVDKGPIMKRSRPRAQGRAFPIHKHTSHIVVTLTDAVSGKNTASLPSKKKNADAEPKTKKPAAKKKVAAKS